MIRGTISFLKSWLLNRSSTKGSLLSRNVSQSFAAKQQNKMQSVFRRDMRVPKNTSQPASVPKGRTQQAVNHTQKEPGENLGSFLA